MSSAGYTRSGKPHREAREGKRGVQVTAELIDATVPPSGTGCVECEESGGWWFHLRRCALCGHIGCCDTSPSQHASAHAAASGHPLIRSFEPGESWFWSYAENRMYGSGPALAPPEHHPIDQPVPGPAGRVPADWESYLH
jgi:ubiquitin-hydrolase Zn-finger-containing protein